MNPLDVVQALIYGVVFGSIYALVASGFALTLGVMQIVNFAHGHLIAAAGFLSLLLFRLWAVDPFVSIAATVPLAFVLGAALYTLVLRHVVMESHHTQIIVTLGIGLIIENVLLLAFGGDLRLATTAYTSRTVRLGGLALSVPKIAAAVLAVVTVSLLWAMLRYTKLGKAIRASTDNWQAATLMGIDVRRVRLYAFGLSAMTAAVAGSSLPTFYLLSPFSGLEFLLKAFAIVVIGGVEDVRGVVIAGLLLGLLEAAAGVLFSAALGSAFTFAVVLVFLAWRPSGLLGRA